MTINPTDVNTVWKWRSGGSYPVIIRVVSNVVNTPTYPTMVTFETVSGGFLTLSAAAFTTSLIKTEHGPMKFTALRKIVAEFNV
ncbi:MAG: hypothetical protein NTZ20_05265 [Candidatus Levybacteria bacterium]|nr:hypothetical protein [Candidatus Levybacteria bacterium]